MTALTDEQLNEIAARAERATAAPWRRKNAGGWSVDREDGGSAFVGIGETAGNEVIALVVAPYPGDDDLLSDADFIAHARADIPALLATIANLKEAERKVKMFAKAIAVGDEAFTGEEWEAMLCEAEAIRDMAGVVG